MSATADAADRSGVDGGLGANPIEFITRSTGTWTLAGLLVTLSVTPLRRLTWRADFIRYRRMLGLVKKDITEPMLYGAMLALLLAMRLPWGGEFAGGGSHSIPTGPMADLKNGRAAIAVAQ